MEEQSSMKALHKKIRALHAVNDEIIERVENVHEVRHYDYFAFFDDGLVLKEETSTVKGFAPPNVSFCYFFRKRPHFWWAQWGTFSRTLRVRYSS